MSQKAIKPPLAPVAGTTALAKAEDMTLKAPGPAAKAMKAQAEQAAKHRHHFIEKHCRSDVSEEWKKVDDQKIAKLRGILAALQEENQSTQILKKASENAEAKRSLEATRSSYNLRLDACKEKEAFFMRKQEELRQHVQDNEKSLKELESNIEKGEKKSKDEQAECRRLDGEIKMLDKDHDDQQAAKEAELKKIAQASQHKKFLEAVVQECEEDFEGDIEVLINRHNTLEAGNQELHQSNFDLTAKLDSLREECLQEQTNLQNEHLMISSQLHECQVSLDAQRRESQELEARLNKALEEKELKESSIGVIQMAIEQLFTRTMSSCILQQRQKAMLDAVDIKIAPVRGDKGDMRLEEMLEQIVERMRDLKDMHVTAVKMLNLDKPEEEAQIVEEVDVADKVKFSYKESEREQGQHTRTQTKAGIQSDVSGSASGGLSSGPSQALAAAEDAQKQRSGDLSSLFAE